MDKEPIETSVPAINDQGRKTMIDGLYQFLASIGFNEPLHPPITHMPIGLVVGALVFFLIAIVFKRKNLVLSARHASILAFAFAFPTILFGVFDWIHFYKAALIAPIVIKMALAGIVILVLGAGIILGSEIRLHSMWMTIIYAAAFICVIGLGYFGAGIIYGRGTGNANEQLTKQELSGKEVFTMNCGACHANGENSIDPRYPLKTSQKIKDQAGFIAFVRDPKTADGSPGNMPAFMESDISGEKAGDLFAYINAMNTAGW
jgi:uncharacterized membrane protein